MKKNSLEIYNTLASDWWDSESKLFTLNHLNPPRFEYFNQFIDFRGKKVLDLGCGGGFTSEFLYKNGAEVWGIDQSEGLIKAASDHAKMQDLKINYIHGKGDSLPFSESFFDVVVCVDVLEHLDDVDKTLSEISRVLKHDGYFFFDTINRTFKSKVIMIWILEYLLREIPLGVHDWDKFITPSELEDSLISKGFSKPHFQGLKIKGKNPLKSEFTRDLSVIYLGHTQKKFQDLEMF